MGKRQIFGNWQSKNGTGSGTKKVIGTGTVPKADFNVDNNPTRRESPFGKVGARAGSFMKPTPPGGPTVSAKVKASQVRAKGRGPSKREETLAQQIAGHLAPSGKLRGNR